ncbi:S-adenosyl-L-methionine-dependent methyltransferase [Tylopilus felleus]
MAQCSAINSRMLTAKSCWPTTPIEVVLLTSQVKSTRQRICWRRLTGDDDICIISSSFCIQHHYQLIHLNTTRHSHSDLTRSLSVPLSIEHPIPRRLLESSLLTNLHSDFTCHHHHRPDTCTMNTVDFDPSLLGTKDHWDQRYSEELAHFCEDGLEGEVWFGEEPVEKMAEWASTHVPATLRPSVLDVGTGNGHLLFAMVEAGYDATRLTGIDYSQGSVDLSAAIAKHRDETESGDKGDGATYANVTFAVCDFLDPASPVPPPREEGASDGAWDLVLDKGTFDAISLMDEDERGAAPLERYVPRVVKLLRPGGHFLITSCNFTEDELIKKIAAPGSSLVYKGSVPYKQFTFGGKSGSSYATVAFRKQ